MNLGKMIKMKRDFSLETAKKSLRHRNILICMISKLLNMLKPTSWLITWFIKENISFTLEINMHSNALGWSVI